MRKIGLINALLLMFVFNASAQIFSNKVVGEKKLEERDSLKQAVYPYMLPIWGEKVTKLGFDLPYSAGFSTQYFYQESDILINNLFVGFNDGTMYDLDEIVRFNKATARTNSISVRPDVWLFPFLNVYGIFARSNNDTNVDFGVYVPGEFHLDPDLGFQWNWVKAMDFKTEANFEASTYGFGLTPTMGVGGGFIALDMNWSWSDIPELSEPARIFVFGPRFGKNFQFGKPGQSLAVWVGGFRVKMNTGTSGSLSIDEVLPGFDDQIAGAYEKIEKSQMAVDDWWSGLTIQEKADPINIAKRTAANKGLSVAGSVVDAASRAETVQYSLDKRQAKMWNFIVGSQYQLNKSWALRAEVGFLGTRTHVISGLQYRFGL
ncbi:hypothetical protein [Carboxylicivirga marina]|uniref:hypothetical protein n=1 Tax=Carboxylicivirga marina TaxID=2800988 RepID=UPI0025950B90|nr:hypothetical protein [uncultured Carboxylicivirga sp.]